ncbi:complex I NDUFA9 subunit family protein [Nitrospirillum sp. BR 11164]|uniref:complex I NDUFA9 subunit family protein n=1 Tax=Nitrospirillum sp. BR 11164 TaxID=3104324 RepID=UPI002AFF074F|nr:complex I NDUFA9 subunit family protein [Nitrospirillum sp. BR 11164]MEA1649376.1 complex I NDUFA9 subunit family protein [Nitrospirillum sp. BR 11164]
MGTSIRIATVFGGAGFIGRHVIRRLAKTGCVIRVPARHPGEAAFLKMNGAVGQIVPMAVDIADDASVARAIQGADVVINLMGILAESGRQRFDLVHAEAAGRIARLAKGADVARLVHVSALGADANSRSAYARSKAAGEQAVRAVFPEATILRPSVIFGPEDNFFNRFAGMAKTLPFVPLIGGGATRFQPVYVGDVADAIISAVTRAGAEGKTFELGGPRAYSFRELIQLVLDLTGRKTRLVSVPWGLASLQAAFLEMVPGKPLTRDQVTLLKSDNVLSGTLPGLADLGVTPTAAEVILPTYLDRFQLAGRYDSHRQGPSLPALTKIDAHGTHY